MNAGGVTQVDLNSFAPKIALSNSPLTFPKADATLSVGARGVCSMCAQ